MLTIVYIICFHMMKIELTFINTPFYFLNKIKLKQQLPQFSSFSLHLHSFDDDNQRDTEQCLVRMTDNCDEKCDMMADTRSRSPSVVNINLDKPGHGDYSAVTNKPANGCCHEEA